jgi:hypothetical protein
VTRKDGDFAVMNEPLLACLECLLDDEGCIDLDMATPSCLEASLQTDALSNGNSFLWPAVSRDGRGGPGRLLSPSRAHAFKNHCGGNRTRCGFSTQFMLLAIILLTFFTESRNCTTAFSNPEQQIRVQQRPVPLKFVSGPGWSIERVTMSVTRHNEAYNDVMLGRSQHPDTTMNPDASREAESLFTLPLLLALLSASLLLPCWPVNAFDIRQEFPQELEMVVESATTTRPASVGPWRGAAPASLGREYSINKVQQQTAQMNRQSPIRLLGPWASPITSSLWAGALWLLSGSRSNPLVTPIANALYKTASQESDAGTIWGEDVRDEPESQFTDGAQTYTSDQQQATTIVPQGARKDGDPQWLLDRNAGLFADVPASVYGVLLIVFLTLGYLSDLAVVALADGDRGASFQLGGVALIGGSFWELGRIASGEKKLTRVEADRTVMLRDEFAAFAAARLVPGGSCHRVDVIRSFRRYYAKYRQADNPSSTLSDREIEQLLRDYARAIPTVEITSAGFYNGIKVNKRAELVQ